MKGLLKSVKSMDICLMTVLNVAMNSPPPFARKLEPMRFKALRYYTALFYCCSSERCGDEALGTKGSGGLW